MVNEELARIQAESLAETAVNAHAALVAQLENDLNANFEKELTKEKEKAKALEKLAEEVKVELDRLKTEREDEHNSLIKEHAAVESEMEVLSRLRHELEEQLQSLMSNKLEISFERDKINKLRQEAESQNQVIAQLQYELEVERKAMYLARYFNTLFSSLWFSNDILSCYITYVMFSSMLLMRLSKLKNFIEPKHLKRCLIILKG